MTSEMKALFWKECRENLRWAVLALLALSLGLAYAWYHLSQQPAYVRLEQIWSSENLVLTISTPLIGLALGLLQVLPELRRDQWAFLVHRPASRTTLFFGKVVPGVCLYLLATILPLLGLAVWASSPNHVPAPFDFRFTLAGWASILAGLPFYFAGLLVALRPARWYGSRALPLLTALLAPWAATFFWEFWQTALACFAIIAVLALAAWGSFISGGEYDEQTKPARSALGLTLYPAVLAVGLGLLMALIATYNALAPKPLRNDSEERIDWKMDTQGRVLVVTTKSDSREKEQITATDLARRPIDSRVLENINQQHKFLELDYLFLKFPLGGNAFQDGYYRYTDPARYIQELTETLSDNQQTIWYYETGSRQVLCYDVHRHVVSIVGYLGPNGFSANREQAGHFEGLRPGLDGQVGAGYSLLRFPRTVYWYRTNSPTIGVLQAASGQSGVAGITTLGMRDGRDRPNSALAIAADGHITVYARGKEPGDAPRKLFTTPVAFAPADTDTSPGVHVAMTSDRSRFFFWYSPSGKSQPNHIVTVAADGHVLKMETIPPAPAEVDSRPPRRRFVEADPALLFPPATVSAFAFFAYLGHSLGWPSAAGFWNTFDALGAIFFFSALNGLFAAVFAWLISRRLGDNRRGQIAWAVGVFLLGGYGVLLLLALRAWPARVPCPNCGRQRVVNRETCEYCGAAFARPKRDGTEIFEEAREMAGR
jgi:hypothetical protein